MEKSDIDDPKAKAKADREKFESVKKVETAPMILNGSRRKRTLVAPELKSPDEKNPKWITDPEEILAARKAAKKVKSDPNTQT
jgi:hypothetical protein